MKYTNFLVRLLLTVFVFLTDINTQAQGFFEPNNVHYYQILQLTVGNNGTNYGTELVRDSFLLDSNKSGIFYYKTFTTQYNCNHKLFISRHDTNYWMVDSNNIYFTGRERTRYFRVKKYNYWQFHKKVGDTIFTNFTNQDLIADKLKFTIDSIKTVEIYGKNRMVYYLSNLQYRGLHFIQGLGYSADLMAGINVMFDNPLLLVCNQQNIKYWYDSTQWGFKPLKTPTCDFDTMAREFSDYHTASTNSLDFAEINVYPNPAQNIINLISPPGFKINEIKITDIRGSVWFLKSGLQSIQISAFPEGMYFLTICTDKGNQMAKFIVQR